MKTYGRNAAGFSMREIVFTGLMTALVFVATYVPHIPIPLGYAHLGDAVIFLLAVLAPRRSVLFAACLGSAMADIFGGFALWAGPTILIKLIMAEIVCRLGRSNAAPARAVRGGVSPRKPLDGGRLYPRRSRPLRRHGGGTCLHAGAHCRGHREQHPCTPSGACPSGAYSAVVTAEYL